MRRATQTVWVSICLLSLLLHVTHLVMAAAALDQRGCSERCKCITKKCTFTENGESEKQTKTFQDYNKKIKTFKSQEPKKPPFLH